MVPAVLLPAFFVFQRAERLFFAVAHGLDAAGVDTLPDQLLFHRIRTACTEHQVVLFGEGGNRPMDDGIMARSSWKKKNNQGAKQRHKGQ